MSQETKALIGAVVIVLTAAATGYVLAHLVPAW